MNRETGAKALDKRKVIYYRDEQNDEFSTAQITPRPIDGDYRYDRTFFLFPAVRFFLYRVVATPLAFLYTKLKFRHKIIGKSVLKPFRKTGYFLYGNHTQDIGDPLMPNMMNFPKDVYFLVHANNVSMPLLGRINPYLGAIPLPDDLAAYRNFIAFVEKQISKNACIVIYPEAHIWPYYTGIRDFSAASFAYPVKFGTPVFCFTNTYQKRRFSGKPKIVTYIDGPFYPDPALSQKKQAKGLRDAVYERMCERAKNSTVQVIQYIKKED